MKPASCFTVICNFFLYNYILSHHRNSLILQTIPNHNN